MVLMSSLRSESDVESKFLAPLFSEVLGYSSDSLHWDEPVRIQLGREKKTKHADLVVLHDGLPVVAVEAKSPREPVRSGLGQVDSYAFALQTKFSVVTNGLQFVVRGYYAGNSRINVVDSLVEELEGVAWSPVRNLIGIDNISAAITEPENPVRPLDDLKIQDYRKFFRKIHNEIRDRDKLAPDAAFDELSKLLFLKAAEDESGKKSVLTPKMIEEWESLGRSKSKAMVNAWFQSATSDLFVGVFDDQPRLELSPETLKLVLEMLKDFHVKNGDVDVKGRAFEEFLPSQLRGKGLGQFFTPRPVVNLMSDMAGVSIHDVVVDFSCGSGGFLIRAFDQMKRGVEQLPAGTLARLGTTCEEMLDDIKSNQIFGVDAEPRAARTAKMNMLMWGDGRRVVRGNALDTKDSMGQPYEPREFSASDPGSGCTVILANPPFGSKEKDKSILNRYTLVTRTGKPKKTEKTEVLFIEKGLKLLRPEGKMLIVLPQGLMSSEKNAFVRDYIHAVAEIRAVISLPRYAFRPSGVPMVNTCVVYLQKFTEEKKRLYDETIAPLEFEKRRERLRSDPEFDYPIFMGIAENIGYEPSGRVTAKPGEKTDLDLLLNDFLDSSSNVVADTDIFRFATERYGDPPIYDDAASVSKAGSLRSSFMIRLSDTAERLDPPYYLLHHRERPLLDSLHPLAGRIKHVSKAFQPTTDGELDAEYDVLSVTNDGLVTWNKRVRGELFRKMKQVRAGDIAYNPMRINIGSVGVVPSALDGGYVSPDYVVVRATGIDPDLVVMLLRSPFYRMYIDVMTTGSIRDRLYFRHLAQIRVPELTPEEQAEILALGQGADTAYEVLRRSAMERARAVSKMHSCVGAASKDQAEAFRALADNWRRETGKVSSPKKKIEHPAYKRIIEMGTSALPLILRELAERPGHWFDALRAITGESPIPAGTKVDARTMRQAWLEWGKEKGHIE
jgi:type I restriction enzyme M protein